LKIGLIDVDGHNWPSLPLMKISTLHKKHGDSVEWWNGLAHYDIVYISKVFTFSPDMEFCINAEKVVRGGTGYTGNEPGYEKNLAPTVEHIYPDYSIYGIYDTAYGFLTRGCPRRCPFCIVSEKEGCQSHQVAELPEFWGGQKYIKLLDPNLLAAAEAENLLNQLAQSKSYIDFSQGLDIRFMDKTRTDIIKRIKIKMLHFAWDNPKQDLTDQFTAVKRWLGFHASKMTVYVLTNFYSSHDEDLRRIYTLRDLGYDPYVMIYDKENSPQETRRLQRWVNNKFIFKSCARFEDYDPKKG